MVVEYTIVRLLANFPKEVKTFKFHLSSVSFKSTVAVVENDISEIMSFGLKRGKMFIQYHLL